MDTLRNRLNLDQFNFGGEPTATDPIVDAIERSAEDEAAAKSAAADLAADEPLMTDSEIAGRVARLRGADRCTAAERAELGEMVRDVNAQHRAAGLLASARREAAGGSSSARFDSLDDDHERSDLATLLGAGFDRRHSFTRVR